MPPFVELWGSLFALVQPQVQAGLAERALPALVDVRSRPAG